MPTALVTGANRGIGLEFCRQLTGKGYDVIAVCREASDALRETGARIEDGVDVTDGRSLRRLRERLDGTRLDLLVNNAGVLRRGEPGRIEDQLDDCRLQFEINSLGPVRVTQALSDCLAEGSRVVIITSRMGSITDNDSGGYYGYRMSKAAVNIAGVSLAHELKPRGIAVGLLHPGYVRTDMTDHEGFVDPGESVAGLIERSEALSMENTGGFWHANGERLPW